VDRFAIELAVVVVVAVIDAVVIVAAPSAVVVVVAGESSSSPLIGMQAERIQERPAVAAMRASACQGVTAAAGVMKQA